MPGKIRVIMDSPNSTTYDTWGWSISRNFYCGQLHEEIFQSRGPKGKKQTVLKSISSLPRTKDTWGSFDKAHFKETPHGSALPAVHWIKWWLVLWNPSQHLVLAATCQVKSRGSSCLGATACLPPPWTKKQELEPIMTVGVSRRSWMGGGPSRVRKYLPAEILDHYS